MSQKKLWSRGECISYNPYCIICVCSSMQIRAKNKVISLPLQPSVLKIPKNIQHNLQVGQKVSVWRSTTAGSKDQNPPKNKPWTHFKLITSEQLGSHHTLPFSENKDTPGEHFKMLLVNSTHSKFKKWLTWEGSTRLLLLTRALLSVPQHQTLLSCQCLRAKLQNSKPSQPHTEQLSSTNTTVRKCPGKSVCTQHNEQNGCVYPSHFRRFLPETKQEIWNVNEVSEDVGLILTKSVKNSSSQPPERPEEKQAWWLKERKPEHDQKLLCKLRTVSATEPAQSAVTWASRTITWMSLVFNKMWGIITLTTWEALKWHILH